jgi:beta-glucanase (GH16 family)
VENRSVAVGVFWTLLTAAVLAGAAENETTSPFTASAEPPATYAGMALVWADEFNLDGRPSDENWTYEQGFVRNEELQWYQPENARCNDGVLVIEARREQVANSQFDPNSRDWRRQRQSAEYTSASLLTRGRHQWQHGRFVLRARIDTRAGLWPAFWTLGTRRGWPACGEIDIMEYYRGDLLANAAWQGGRRRRATWDAVQKPIDQFDDRQWSEKFHEWRMDWDHDWIRLYVDDELLNEIDITRVANNDRQQSNPFREPHYIIVNLAVGGTNGGDPTETRFPARYEIDYVRVYQQQGQ